MWAASHAGIVSQPVCIGRIGPGYSCCSQLLNVIEDFPSFMDLSLDCIYLDFAKVFQIITNWY